MTIQSQSHRHSSEKGPDLPLLDIFDCIPKHPRCDTVVPLLDFLLWNHEGAPFEGISIDGNRLIRMNEVVGRVSIEAPAGATGQDVFTEDTSSRADAPVTGIPAGRLRAYFRAGSATGEYIVTFKLSGGNAVQMVVRVG